MTGDLEEVGEVAVTAPRKILQQKGKGKKYDLGLTFFINCIFFNKVVVHHL